MHIIDFLRELYVDNPHYLELGAEDDIKNLGNIFETCRLEIQNGFNVIIDEVKFLETFMVSECRNLMEFGYPTFANNIGYKTLNIFVKFELKGDLTPMLCGDTHHSFSPGQLQWCGGMYSYIRQQTNLETKMIVSKLPIVHMLDLYRIGHQESETHFFRRISHLFSDLQT